MSTPAPPAEVDAALARVRALCLGLPDVTERVSHAFPTFFVGKKVFCYFTFNHHGDGRLAALIRTGLEAQDMLVRMDPARHYLPPYVAHQGYTGIRLEGAARWDLVEDLLRKAHASVSAPPRKAPKRKVSARKPSAASRHR